MLLDLAATFVAALAAFAATISVRRNARRLGIIQAPNERSSHTIPTPSGGGVGIVFGGTVAAAAAIAPSPWPLGLGVLIALAIATIGFLDDRHPLPARYRLLAQLVLVAIAIAICVPLDALVAQVGLPLPAALVATVALVVAVYWINLFNFMDGIDGIAGAQAIFMCCAAALLAYLHVPAVVDEPPFWMLLGLAAAAFGFLLLNWPPAKIFMGDAGSTYIGFMLVFLGLITIAAGWLSLAQWAILAAAFATDATVTLARRLALRETVFEAHRRHAYQVLSRRWGSHRRVTQAFIALNVIWLLPLAWVAGLPGWAWPAVIVAYLPLIILAFCFGAGAPERPTQARI